MQHRKIGNTRMIFSVMVPLTIFAFLLGAATTPLIKANAPISMSVYDIIGMILATVGVFMFNLYEEKPQKASIE